MKKSHKEVNIFSKAGQIMVSAALAATITTVPAFAADSTGSDKIPTGPVTTASSYITGAASRAAGPVPEILGLASVEESGQFVSTTDWYSWDQPKYYLAASTYNTAISPYLANLATGQSSDKAILNTSRSGSGAGPNAALSASDPTDAQVLALANVVIGNGGGTDVSAVEYKFSNYSGLVTTMYNVAAAADSADAADSQKTLRYKDSSGSVISATSIAQNYEKYIFGTMGAVQNAIDLNPSLKKTVAVVTGATQNDVTGVWTFSLMTTAGSGGDGTASTNRYLETTANTGILDSDGDVAIELADNYGDVKSTGVTVDDLKNVDLIMVGGQQSSKNYDTIIGAIEDSDLIGKTYAVKDNGSAGAMYGVVMNSVENAQNIGRILGMLYPTIVSQQNWMAYYYQNFYHIDGTELGTVMNQALKGVRCQAVAQAETMDEAQIWSVPEVSASGVSGYTDGATSSTVQGVIDAGYRYYQEITQ